MEKRWLTAKKWLVIKIKIKNAYFNALLLNNKKIIIKCVFILYEFFFYNIFECFNAKNNKEMHENLDVIYHDDAPSYAPKSFIRLVPVKQRHHC